MIKALCTLPNFATSVAEFIGKFVIPGVVMIKTRLKKATKAELHRLFGKVVIVRAGSP